MQPHGLDVGRFGDDVSSTSWVDTAGPRLIWLGFSWWFPATSGWWFWFDWAFNVIETTFLLYYVHKFAKTRWWQLKYFLFLPRFFGEMIEFDFRIFFNWVSSTTNQPVMDFFFSQLQGQKIFVCFPQRLSDKIIHQSNWTGCFPTVCWSRKFGIPLSIQPCCWGFRNFQAGEPLWSRYVYQGGGGLLHCCCCWLLVFRCFPTPQNSGRFRIPPFYVSVPFGWIKGT